MEEAKLILEGLLKDCDDDLCKWKIVYDALGIEHRKDRCKECIGKGYIRDTYCSSYTKNGQE